jgi:hypothetical protein
MFVSSRGGDLTYSESPIKILDMTKHEEELRADDPELFLSAY